MGTGWPAPLRPFGSGRTHQALPLQVETQVPEKPSSRPPHTTNSSTRSLSRTPVAPPVTPRQPLPHQLLSTAIAADRRGQRGIAATSIPVPAPVEPQPKALETRKRFIQSRFSQRTLHRRSPTPTMELQPRSPRKMSNKTYFPFSPLSLPHQLLHRSQMLLANFNQHPHLGIHSTLLKLNHSRQA